MPDLIFHVDPAGNDDWAGTLAEPAPDRTDGPLATLPGAQQAVRRQRQRAPAGRIRVVIHAGVYRLTAPFTLEPEDSGAAAAPVSYEAAGSEKSVITGGLPITGWTRHDERLWKAELPAVKAGQWFFHQLFVNGERRVRARLPADGQFFTVADALTPQDPATKKYAESAKSGFRFQPGDIPQGFNPAEGEMVILHRWEISRSRIAAIDEARHVVRLSTPAQWPIFGGPKARRYFIDNVFAGLDQPGTWYLDRAAGVLYYHPRAGEDPDRAEVIAPCLNTLVQFRGRPESGRWVEHIILKGLTFEHADWFLPEAGYPGLQAAYDVPAAIDAAGARCCALDDCEIARVGTYGVSWGRGCQDNRITGCRLYDLGAGGIKVGEGENRKDDRDEACRNLVSDNRIHDGGRVYFGAVGIFVGQSGHNRIAHNEIYDLPYSGISVGWNWEFTPNRAVHNDIAFNHIHHVMRRILSDGGGIYTLGISPGTQIRNNLIHDLYGHSDTRGIYLDAASCGIIVENNIVYNTLSPGMRLQVCATGNLIINNIFALARQFQLGFDTDRPNVFMRNIVYWQEGTLFKRPAWDSYDTFFDFNLYYDVRGGPIRFMEHSAAEWQALKWRPYPGIESQLQLTATGLDLHSLIGVDPQFIDPEHGDFRLRPDSPALALGFRPIDMRDVGPRSEATAAEWD